MPIEETVEEEVTKAVRSPQSLGLVEVVPGRWVDVLDITSKAAGDAEELVGREMSAAEDLYKESKGDT